MGLCDSNLFIVSIFYMLVHNQHNVLKVE